MSVLPPRFGDTFTPSVQRVPSFGDRVSVMGGSPGGYGSPELARAADLVRQYNYWTYVALRPICNVFAGQRPRIGVPKPGSPANADEMEPVANDHPLRVLLEHVNEDDSWQEFAVETCQQWHLTGRFYWWMVPSGFGVPVELYVVPTAWVTPQYDRFGGIRYYDVRTEAGENWEFPPEEILEGKFKSPLGKRSAFSPLCAAPGWQKGTAYIEKAREFAFKRGVNPDVMIELAESYGLPAKETLDRIENRFLNRVGGVENAGKPLFLPPGITAKPWSHTPKEMAFGESANQNRDDVLALWGTSKAVVGITEDVNRASFEGAMVAFCSMTINPLLDLFGGIMTEKLARRFDPRIRVWFDDCTPNDAENDLRQQQADFAMGALTPNERRQLRGREPILESPYETGWLPGGLVPLAEESRQDMDDDPPPDDDDPDDYRDGDDGDGE